MDRTPWNHIVDKLRKPGDPDHEELQNWLYEDPGNQTVLDDLKIIYSVAGNAPEPFKSQEEIAWKRILNRISVPKKQGSTIRLMFRIAASFLLIISGLWGGYFLSRHIGENTYSEVFSPYGHKTLVVLPDQSKVWLNGNSKIKYNTSFSDSRNIELTGEALFEVTKNPDKLFTVKSKNLKIEVYGTTFNLKSYDDDMVSEVALVEGSIGLFNQDQLLKRMTPGEVVSYDRQTNQFDTQKGNMSQITSWKSDELIIANETFTSMARYLEHWYGVNISLDQSLEHDLRLSFKVKTESLTELLSIINHITPISYEINGKEVKISKRTNGTTE